MPGGTTTGPPAAMPFVSPYPVQSSAWEILALAIRYIDTNASEGIYISHHVYDELTLVAPDHLVGAAAQLLHEAFVYGYQEVFPGCDTTGIVEVGAGNVLCGLVKRIDRSATCYPAGTVDGIEKVISELVAAIRGFDCGLEAFGEDG